VCFYRRHAFEIMLVGEGFANSRGSGFSERWIAVLGCGDSGWFNAGFCLPFGRNSVVISVPSMPAYVSVSPFTEC
jgi:hypothetical protein